MCDAGYKADTWTHWVEILPPGESVQTVEAFCRAVNLAVHDTMPKARPGCWSRKTSTPLKASPAPRPTNQPSQDFHPHTIIFTSVLLCFKHGEKPPTLPSCHSRPLSLFRTFLLLQDFSHNKFWLDNIKAEDRAGWKSQFHALKENYPFSVSLQFCHIIVVLSWGADKIWLNGNSGKVKFYDIGLFW